MQCWTCGTSLSILGPISFRASCDKCGADLHCCKNCKFYKPGLPNDCAIPGTDYIADRSKNNYCEEFSILGKGPGAGPNTQEKKKGFEDLFK